MTKKTEDQESPDNERRFLSTEERVICGQIASSEPPHSSRAQALLAIDEGATHAEASRQSGLTRGQLQYWLGKFRKDRTSIFPIELLNLGQQGEEDSPQSSPDEQELEPTAGVEEVQQESPDAEEMACISDCRMISREIRSIDFSSTNSPSRWSHSSPRSGHSSILLTGACLINHWYCDTPVKTSSWITYLTENI